MNSKLYADEGSFSHMEVPTTLIAGSWVAPLPTHMPTMYLPNNWEEILAWLKSLSRLLLRKPEMKIHFVEFMD